MSVGLVIVTHGSIGESLVRAAEFILDTSLEDIQCVEVTQIGAELPDTGTIRDCLVAAENGQGVLVLTDLACASPSNFVEQLVQEGSEQFDGLVVSGVNLPMLLRTWNYRDETLGSLALRASEGGQMGIGIRNP
ncbi:MAG TPA: hypothetical protein VJ984_16490 [Xanthomonadales bacterium]|nr:hypothetical protein [Xanthomonadales bacterium]